MRSNQSLPDLNDIQSWRQKANRLRPPDLFSAPAGDISRPFSFLGSQFTSDEASSPRGADIRSTLQALVAKLLTDATGCAMAANGQAYVLVGTGEDEFSRTLIRCWHAVPDQDDLVRLPELHPSPGSRACSRTFAALGSWP